MLASATPDQLAELEHLLLAEFHDKEFDKCKSAPLYWARNYTNTEDPKWKEHGATSPYIRFPYKPQPGHSEDYFDVVMRYMQTCKRLFIPKSREVLTSWLAMVYCTHACIFRPGTLVICQTESEEKVKGLIHYVEVLYEQQEDWLKARVPLVGEGSVMQKSWANGSRLMGIPHGEHKIRLYHPTIFVLDEAAFLSEGEESYNAANPVAEQIIAVSSAAPGWMAQMCDPTIEVKADG